MNHPLLTGRVTSACSGSAGPNLTISRAQHRMIGSLPYDNLGPQLRRSEACRTIIWAQLGLSVAYFTIRTAPPVHYFMSEWGWVYRQVSVSQAPSQPATAAQQQAPGQV